MVIRRKKGLLVQAIIDAANHLRQMRVSPQEILDGLIFPNEPFNRQLSKELLSKL